MAGILRTAVALTIALAVIVGSGIVLKSYLYSDFLKKVENLKSGDSAERVRTVMAPYTPTVHNEDLGVLGDRVLVFRRIDIITLIHLDGSNQVSHIEQRKR